MQPRHSAALGNGPAAEAVADLDRNSVRSVDRAVSLLLALGNVDSGVGVTEIARSLGLHKSTASRLLATLQKRGLVDQDGQSGKYRLGVAMVLLVATRRRCSIFGPLPGPSSRVWLDRSRPRQLSGRWKATAS